MSVFFCFFFAPTFTFHGFSSLAWFPVPIPMKDEYVLTLSEKYHKTPAQILIRHLHQRGLGVVAKSINENRIKENWNVCFKCTDGIFNRAIET